MLADYRCHWGSPAIDLICLLDKIVTPALKATHRREIVYAYYQHFVQILDKIGYLGVVPRLVELQMELLRKGFLGQLIQNFKIWFAEYLFFFFKLQKSSMKLNKLAQVWI